MNIDYPKNKRRNLEWRVRLLQKAHKDESFRAEMKELFHRDLLFAFNAFFYTYDPRKRPFHHSPFTTWDFQDEWFPILLEHINSGEDLVIEKSRDMGASWGVIGVYVHQWLDPKGGSDFLLGSRIEDYVDKRGDMRTLFEKARYLLRRLPYWLRPEGFKFRKHDNYMKLKNPETGATISGESNNPNFSTGGRYASALFDEFGKWESTDKAAWTAAGDATPCRVAVSTPFGAAGQYYSLVTDGRIRKIRLHWSLHPEKQIGLGCIWPPPNEEDYERLGENWKPEVIFTSPWYERQKSRRSPTEMAQEVDMDYLGAGRPVFDGKAMNSLKFYREFPDFPKFFGKISLKHMTVQEVPEPRDWEGHLIIYNEFNKSCQYSIGCDVAEGLEDGDYSTVTVFNRTTWNVDAVYWSLIDEVLLSRIVKAASDFYSPEPDSSDAPWTGIETNGPGLSTFDHAVELGVGNLFMAPRFDVTNQTVSYKKGWRTDTVSKNELISGIRDYLIRRAGDLNNQRLVGELLTFVRSKTGKAGAKEGTHDDMVISFGIALQVHEIAPFDTEAEPTRKQATIGEIARTKPERDEAEPQTHEDLCFQTAMMNKSSQDFEINMESLED